MLVQTGKVKRSMGREVYESQDRDVGAVDGESGGRVEDCAGRTRGRHARGGVLGWFRGFDRDAHGKGLDSPPPPTAYAEMMRSPFRKAFEHSKRVEINCLYDVECFARIDNVSESRKIVASKWDRKYIREGYDTVTDHGL